MSLREITREQSRLIFNGPVGCYKQLTGLFYLTALKCDLSLGVAWLEARSF
jgi:hypothetical protein